MGVPTFPAPASGGGGGGLPSGTGIVTVTGGTGGLGVPYVDYLPGGDWYATEQAAHKAAVPSFTSFVPLPLGLSHVGETISANLTDAGVEGGAVKPTGGSAWGTFTKPTVWQNLATSKFALSIECAMTSIGSGKSSYVGMINSGFAKYLAVIVDSSLGGAATTDIVVQASDGTGTGLISMGAWDASPHTYRFIFDVTTCSIYKDTVLKGTILESATHWPTGTPFFPATFGSTSNTGTAIYRMAYSFVGV